MLRQTSSDVLFPSIYTLAQNANSKDGIRVIMASTFVCTEFTFCTCGVVFPQPSVFSSGDRLTSNSPKPQDSGTFLVITECHAQTAIIQFFTFFFGTTFANVLEDLS